MKRCRKTYRLLLAICLLIGTVPRANAQQPNIVVIAHKSVGCSCDVNMLRVIFSRRMPMWPDGQRTRVFVYSPDSELHKQFVITRLDLLPYQLSRTWTRLQYSGYAVKPEVVQSQKEMIDRVAYTPGSIGYIDMQANIELPVGVKVIEP